MKKVLEQEVKVTQKDIDAVLKQDISKSKKMVGLFNLGLEVKVITDIMTKHQGKPMRYNFVYNVVSNYCNMNGIKTETSEKSGKKDQIIEMYLAKKSNKEIAIDLKTNYNYVFNVLKTFKAEHPDKVWDKKEAAQ